MKVVILYRPKSEHRRAVEEFIDSLKSRTRDVKIETMNIDSKEGATIASLYDIMQYPAVLVMQDSGAMHKMWQGSEVPPLLDEVISYVNV